MTTTPPKSIRVLSILVIVGGVILMAAGAFTWAVVTKQLSDEKITVSDDADHFAGQDVNGPFTAYAQANVIRKHALEASGGKTYAQLPQDDPKRDTVMTASFLRASLFTSVVSFGVAFFAFGMGILMILIGWALLGVNKSLRPAFAGGAAPPEAAAEPEPAPAHAATAAPAAAPAAEAAPETAAEPTAGAETGAERAAEPAPETGAEPAADTGAERAAETPAEPASETGAETAAEPAPEASSEAAPSTEPTTGSDPAPESPPPEG